MALPLDLPDVRVLASRLLQDGTLLRKVESTLPTAQYYRCGRELERLHGYDRPIRLRHLPVFGRTGGLEMRPKRYRCPVCEGGPTTTPRCSWYDPNRPHTTAFEPWRLKHLVHSTVADVSRQLELGIKAVEGIGEHDVAAAVDWAAFTRLDTLGIDEVALSKGRGHAVAVLWTCGAVRATHVLAVLPNQRQATVQALLETMPTVLKTTVRRVCIDRGQGYAGAVAAALPAAEVGVDRFHVAVQDHPAVDDLRQQECRRLNTGLPVDQALPTAERRSLLRREGSSLNPAQQDQWVNRFQQSPALATADLLRTTLIALFACSLDRATAQTRLQRWGEPVKTAGITCVDKFLMTVQHWQDGMLNYFKSRPKSGFVEGLNNKLKVLKRRGFGLDDPIQLFQRLW